MFLLACLPACFPFFAEKAKANRESVCVRVWEARRAERKRNAVVAGNAAPRVFACVLLQPQPQRSDTLTLSSLVQWANLLDHLLDMQPLPLSHATRDARVQEQQEPGQHQWRSADVESRLGSGAKLVTGSHMHTHAHTRRQRVSERAVPCSVRQQRRASLYDWRCCC